MTECKSTESRQKKKRGTKNTKGTVKLINVKQTDNTMAKNEKDKQTTAHMTQHTKRINNTNPTKKPGAISGAP